MTRYTRIALTKAGEKPTSSSGGVQLWANLYNGPGTGFCDGRAIAVDNNGNVFVTGDSAGNGTTNDLTTIAYSNSGVPLWTNRYNGPGNNNDRANAIAVDSRSWHRR